MKYLIYCKFTNKYLATYTNEKTLENLDTSRCYAVEYEDPKPKEKINEFGVHEKSGKKEKRHGFKNSSQVSSSSNTTNDYMSPSNPIGYYATMSSFDNSSSSSSCDSSSSSCDLSSSSSCDSSSW